MHCYRRLQHRISGSMRVRLCMCARYVSRMYAGFRSLLRRMLLMMPGRTRAAGRPFWVRLLKQLTLRHFFRPPHMTRSIPHITRNMRAPVTCRHILGA